jgi:proteasome activator subunit 4
VLLTHRPQILHLLGLLVDRTLSERGFSGAGRLLTRLMHTLSDVYPAHGRYVNEDEWDSEGACVWGRTRQVAEWRAAEFNRDHNLHWGRLYEAKDVKINWHGEHTAVNLRWSGG